MKNFSINTDNLNLTILLFLFFFLFNNIMILVQKKPRERICARCTRTLETYDNPADFHREFRR